MMDLIEISKKDDSFSFVVLTIDKVENSLDLSKELNVVMLNNSGNLVSQILLKFKNKINEFGLKLNLPNSVLPRSNSLR